MLRTLGYASVPLAIVVAALSLACGSSDNANAPNPPAIVPVQPVMPAQPIAQAPQPIVPQPQAALVPMAAVPTAGDFIMVNMQARAAQYAIGMVPATQVFRGNLATGAAQDFQAILQPGKCFKVLGVGGPTVTDLDLYLFDPNGAEVQQDTATDNYPVLGLATPICPTVPGAYRVQVKMFGGTGEFGVQVLQTP